VGVPPEANVSFASKYVELNSAGTLAIDEAVWGWTDAEAAGYNESRLQLWRFYTTNGTWQLLNDTPDTSLNQLSAYSLPLDTPGSSMFIGIFEAPFVSNCPIISSPGLYVQSENLSGAPYQATASDPAVGDLYSCVVINSDDVIYDCGGYQIMPANTSNNATAIFLNRTNNVTVRNCGIADYNYGAVSYGSDATTFRNLTIGWSPSANRSWTRGMLFINGTGHAAIGNAVNFTNSYPGATSMPIYGIHITGTAAR
jgi:hypothetical protein